MCLRIPAWSPACIGWLPALGSQEFRSKNTKSGPLRSQTPAQKPWTSNNALMRSLLSRSSSPCQDWNPKTLCLLVGACGVHVCMCTCTHVHTQMYTHMHTQAAAREGGALRLSPSAEKQHRACLKRGVCTAVSELGGAVEAALGPCTAWNPGPCCTPLGGNPPMRQHSYHLGGTPAATGWPCLGWPSEPQGDLGPHLSLPACW